MTKPEIAAMLEKNCIKMAKDICEYVGRKNCETSVFKIAHYIHDCATKGGLNDALTDATLSNHVIIPEGEFAGIVKSLEFYKDINNYCADLRKDNGKPYFDFKETPVHNDGGELAREALSIARKYAGEGK